MEEYIELLDDFKDFLKEEFSNADVYIKAIENLLKGYKELEEENKKLNTQRIIGNIYGIKIEDLEDILKPYYIPISVIQNKLEKLKREFDFYAGREHCEWQDGEFDGEQCDDIALKIGVLKELLEGEK